MSLNVKAGDPVQLEFSSADASTAAAITIKDGNNATRTLQSYERLLIDSLIGDIAAGVTADVFDDKDADGTVDAGELLASLGALNTTYTNNDSGLSVTTGNTPKVKSSGAGSVKITGTGRIQFGQGRPVRPSWRESLVPGQ